MYSKALEVGVFPHEFWEMSLREVRDTVNSRFKQRNNEIYTLSGMIRVAVLSVFSKDVRFPSSPDSGDTDENWKNSKKYLKALQQKQRQGGAKWQ